jgi:hypothetical protein
MPLVSGIPLFVVPRRHQAMLCTVEDRRLVEINPVPVPITDETNVQTYEMSATGWIVWIHPEVLDAIGCFHSDAEPTRRFPSIPLPARHTARALAFNGDVLYVASSPAPGFIDFGALDPEWRPLPGAQPVDDSEGSLACDGRQLIAGETEGHDLALHALDVTDPRSPVTRERRVVLRRWNSESLFRVALGKTWLAALVIGWGFGGESAQIRFHDPQSLEEYGDVAVELAHPVFFSGEPIVNPPQWSDVAFLDDTLFIAAGTHGVGVLDLRGLAKPAQPRRSRREYNSDFCRDCAGRLFYIPLPEGVSGAVLRIFPVPTTGQVLAVFHDNWKFDSVLLDGATS